MCHLCHRPPQQPTRHTVQITYMLRSLVSTCPFPSRQRHHTTRPPRHYTARQNWTLPPGKYHRPSTRKQACQGVMDRCTRRHHCRRPGHCCHRHRHHSPQRHCHWHLHLHFQHSRQNNSTFRVTPPSVSRRSTQSPEILIMQPMSSSTHRLPRLRLCTTYCMSRLPQLGTLILTPKVISTETSARCSFNKHKPRPTSPHSL